MQLKIELISKKKIILPTSFNSILQGVIYNIIEKQYAEWLHNKGYKNFSGRTYKLFTYSSFLEKGLFKREKQQIIFPEKISFKITSPLDNLIEEIATSFANQNIIYLQHNKTYVSNVVRIPNPNFSENKIRIQTLSPIQIYSTFIKPHDPDKKIKHFYSPGEKDFSKVINENLQRKWEATYNKNCPYDLRIKPVDLKKCKEKVIKFKGGIVKAYQGHFIIESNSQDFLKFALNAGLGSKNSNGFGMIEKLQ